MDVGGEPIHWVLVILERLQPISTARRIDVDHFLIRFHGVTDDINVRGVDQIRALEAKHSLCIR